MKMISLLLVSLLALVTGSAFASSSGPDLSSLTGAVNYTTVTAAILAVAALLVVVYLARNAVSQVLGLVKRGG